MSVPTGVVAAWTRAVEQEVVQRRRNRRIIDPAHRITTLKVRTTMLQLPGDWIDEMHEGAVFHVRLTLHVDRAEQSVTGPPYWSARWLEVVREFSD